MPFSFPIGKGGEWDLEHRGKLDCKMQNKELNKKGNSFNPCILNIKTNL